MTPNEIRAILGVFPLPGSEWGQNETGSDFRHILVRDRRLYLPSVGLNGLVALSALSSIGFIRGTLVSRIEGATQLHTMRGSGTITNSWVRPIPPARVVILPKIRVLVEGQTVQFSATSWSEAGYQMDDTYEWYSTNPLAIEVTPEGLARVVGVGHTQIVAVGSKGRTARHGVTAVWDHQRGPTQRPPQTRYTFAWARQPVGR